LVRQDASLLTETPLTIQPTQELAVVLQTGRRALWSA
jgi:hypothetical protein